MFDYHEHVFGILTISLVFVSAISVAIFRFGIPRGPEWLPGLVFMSAMLVVAVSSFLTLFYDHSAGIIQGVTLVAMTICISVDTKSTPQSNAI